MLKKELLSVTLLLLLSSFALAQTSKKLTKAEIAKMTPEQRLVHETDRKSKHGKKKISGDKKTRIANRQDRRSRRIKNPR